MDDCRRDELPERLPDQHSAGGRRAFLAARTPNGPTCPAPISPPPAISTTGWPRRITRRRRGWTRPRSRWRRSVCSAMRHARSPMCGHRFSGTSMHRSSRTSGSQAPRQPRSRWRSSTCSTGRTFAPCRARTSSATPTSGERRRRPDTCDCCSSRLASRSKGRWGRWGGPGGRGWQGRYRNQRLTSRARPASLARPTRVLRALCAALISCAACTPAPPSNQAAVTPSTSLITGGHVVDGTGAPWFAATSASRATASPRSGISPRQSATRRIDATGLIVAPGFIDMLGQSEFNVLVDGRAASKITQGVTTEITGEGSSIAPLNDRLFNEAKPQFERYGSDARFPHAWRVLHAARNRSRTAINIGSFVGAGGLRSYVIGDVQRDSDACRARSDEGSSSRSDGAGRARPRHIAAIRTEPVCVDQRARGAGIGRGALRRDLHVPPTIGVGADRLLAGRSVHHRQAGEDSGRGLAPQGGLQGQLGPHASGPGAAGARTSGRARHHGEHVSVRSGVERPRRVPADLGARRRSRADARPPRRPGAA